MQVCLWPPSKLEKTKKAHRWRKSEKPLYFCQRTENQMLKNGKPGNCNGQQNPKTDLKNGQNRNPKIPTPRPWKLIKKSIFLASSQTVLGPLSSFDTHARWQPVTQSARSRRSYGKIEGCEQSSLIIQNEFERDALEVIAASFKLQLTFRSVNKASVVLHSFIEESVKELLVERR